jgi:hypothetical protein
MIALSSLAVGVLLIVLLLAVGVKGWLASRDSADLLAGDDEIGPEGCPPVFVGRIFSPLDWRYVHGMKSPDIEKLFRKERRTVALVWVQQTSLAIRRVMREHAAIARQSSNLEPATELKIFMQFAALLVTCRAIRLGIDLAGPMRIGRLARYAHSLAQQVAQAEQAFELATQQRAKMVQ